MKSTLPPTQWKDGEFFEACGLLQEEVSASGLEWHELAAIYDHHNERIETLNTIGSYTLDVLRRLAPVHSVRMRVKSPTHLVRKIVRKRLDDSARDIRYANYVDHITDLVGIRALHLYKEDWRPIHAALVAEWNFAEHPTAYIREGDLQAWRDEFAKEGCKVEVHPRNYRSVHYLLRSSPSKTETIVEVQVRTLFEEAWSEIDHRINYPDAAPFAVVAFFLEVFNRLAGTADEMGTFLQALVADLQTRDAVATAIGQERDEAIRKVEELVGKLQITEGKRRELQKELSALKTASPSVYPTLFEVGSFKNYEWPAATTEYLKSALESFKAGGAVFESLQSSSVFSQRRCQQCGADYSVGLLGAGTSTHCAKCAEGQTGLIP